MTFQKLLPAFVAILLQTSNLSAQSQVFAAAIDSAQAAQNQMVCVPLKTVGFTDVVSFQFSIQWDADILAFDHLENYQLPGWDATFFNDIQPNCLVTGWASITGLPITKADGSPLVDLCFTAIAAPGAGSDLVLGDCFPSGNGGNEAYNANNQNIWNPNLFVNGRIDIVSAPSSNVIAHDNGTPSVQLQPNPTTSDATLYLESALPGVGKIHLTNASGQLIWTQTIQYQAGKNAMTIPAEVLNHAGLYQVSLGTENGVVTRLLSVH